MTVSHFLSFTVLVSFFESYLAVVNCTIRGLQLHMCVTLGPDIDIALCTVQYVYTMNSHDL